MADDTEQLTITIRTETLELLRDLYPHHLSDQQRLLAAVTEVEMRREDIKALQLDDRRMGIPNGDGSEEEESE